jgi:uncharacterized membrane protein
VPVEKDEQEEELECWQLLIPFVLCKLLLLLLLLFVVLLLQFIAQLMGFEGRSALRIIGLSACELAVSLVGSDISSIIDAAEAAAAAAAAAITVLMLSPA